MSDEISVLRETVGRIETHSEEISSITNSIVADARAALAKLRPLAEGRGAAAGTAPHRAAIAVLENVRETVAPLAEIRPTLEGGVAAAGPAVFGRAWEQLDALLAAMTATEERRKFYGIVGEIQKLQQSAEDSLRDALRSDARRVFGEDEDPDAGDVASLGELLSLARARNRTREANALVVGLLRRSATAAASSHPVETTAALKKFRANGQNYRKKQHALLARLYPQPQAEEYAGLVAEVFRVEEAQLAKKVARLSKGKPQGAMAILDELDVSLQYDPEEDMAGLVQSAVKNLCETYASIDSAVKSQKIENEVSIAGATDRVALIIRDLVKRAQSVEVALGSIAPRAYLPSPAPEWLRDFPLTKTMPTLFDLYCADLVENLLYYIAFQNKKLGRTPWQQGVSLMFNTSFLSHFIEKNGLKHPGSLLFDRIQRSHKQGMKLYMAEWQKLSGHLMDPTQTKPGGKLSSKDREAIKERFRLFNTEFDVLVERQRRASIPDKELRQQLVTEISKTIVPLYQRFYALHSGGDFTKNLEKYVKYDMKKLGEVIATL